ncbi:MAG: cation diffusion facilitator family transporter [Gemmatimonadota bacterium]|nr:cation diffusion facilitator family transporter [Gemmatimonadota bacterium]
MAHDHAGHRPHEGAGPERSIGRLKWTLGLVIVYMAAEVVGGVLTNSLALLADAGHMLSDAGSLSLTLFAMWVAQRPPTPERTFGYYRAEILAALLHGVTLVAVAVYIFVEAWGRLQDPPEVLGPLMMGVAMGGLLVNGIGLWLLREGRNESLNMEGAWLHVLADTLGSLGAIVAGGVIWWTGWRLADPLASILIGFLVLGSSWHLLRQAVAVLLEGAPEHLDVEDVRSALCAVEGVAGVHDLHVWSVTSGMVSLSVHVEPEKDRHPGPLLADLQRMLRKRFGIRHCTIQIEPTGSPEEEPAW